MPASRQLDAVPREGGPRLPRRGGSRVPLDHLPERRRRRSRLPQTRVARSADGFVATLALERDLTAVPLGTECPLEACLGGPPLCHLHDERSTESGCGLRPCRTAVSLKPSHKQARGELEALSPKDSALTSLKKLFR